MCLENEDLTLNKKRTSQGNQKTSNYLCQKNRGVTQRNGGVVQGPGKQPKRPIERHFLAKMLDSNLKLLKTIEKVLFMMINRSPWKDSIGI